MKPDPRFQRQPKAFWATAKLVSEALGYSERSSDRMKRYSAEMVAQCLEERDLDPTRVVDLGWDQRLAEYSEYRANLLEKVVRPALMNEDAARREFNRVRATKSTWVCQIPMNKQKGEKKHENYLGAMVNMLAERELGENEFNSAPGGLITVTRDKVPVRTLARRVDGAFPGINNPHAIWEVKEYYGTTTFGSRVADGVYETMLDGAELVELREVEGIDVMHYLMVDDHFTWWVKGRSYLCRIIDMLHDALIDEVFFGRQVLDEWPETIRTWPTRSEGDDR